MAFIFITSWLEQSRLPPPAAAIRTWMFALLAGLIVQLVYGGLIYFILNRARLWNVWTVLLAYVLPVVAFSWHASDTTQDFMGTIPWLAFASTVALVSWLFAPT
jgi:hypothetical protein